MYCVYIYIYIGLFVAAPRTTHSSTSWPRSPPAPRRTRAAQRRSTTIICISLYICIHVCVCAYIYIYIHIYIYICIMPTAGGFQSGPGELGRRSPAAAGNKIMCISLSLSLYIYIYIYTYIYIYVCVYVYIYIYVLLLLILLLVVQGAMLCYIIAYWIGSHCLIVSCRGASGGGRSQSGQRAIAEMWPEAWRSSCCLASTEAPKVVVLLGVLTLVLLLSSSL